MTRILHIRIQRETAKALDRRLWQAQGQEDSLDVVTVDLPDEQAPYDDLLDKIFRADSIHVG